MGIESWAFAEESKKLEKKKKEIDEKEYKEKMLEIKKAKESDKEDDDRINELNSLLENSYIDTSTKIILEKIIKSEDISQEEIEMIFQKIEEIENIDDIDKFLPKELRITKEDYNRAINDDIYRQHMFVKIDDALWILYEQIKPNLGFWMNLLRWYMVVLDKNLIKIQENNIDIKHSLESIENKKRKKLSLWEKIIIFIKKLFNI